MSGYAILSGPIEITPPDGISADASLMVRGPLAVRGDLDIRVYDNNTSGGRGIGQIVPRTKYVAVKSNADNSDI